MEKIEKLIRYAKTHEKKCLTSVMQFARYFGWDDEAVEILRDVILPNNTVMTKAVADDMIVVSKRMRIKKRRERNKARGRIVDPAADRDMQPKQLPPLPIVGLCECGKPLLGEPIPQCETKKTGRIFYKECSSCGYYSELFMKKLRNKVTYYEVERGEDNGG